MSEPIRNIKVYAKKNGVYEEIKADVVGYTENSEIGHDTTGAISFENAEFEKLPANTEIKVEFYENDKIVKCDYFITQ